MSLFSKLERPMFLDSCMRRGKYIRPTPHLPFSAPERDPSPSRPGSCAPKRRQNLVNALWLNCVKREQVKSRPKTAIGSSESAHRPWFTISDRQSPDDVRTIVLVSNVDSALGIKPKWLYREGLCRDSPIKGYGCRMRADWRAAYCLASPRFVDHV